MPQKPLPIIILITSLTLPGVALANGMATQDSILRANNEIGLAVTGTLMNYQEHITQFNGQTDIESGWMPGFQVKYSLMGDYFSSLPNLYFAVNYDYSNGNLHYQGFLLSPGTPPSQTTDSAVTNRVVGRLGMGFPLAQSWMLTPYLAGGYQNWDRNLQGTHGGKEKYSAGLVGAGFMLQYAPIRQLVLSANAQGFAVIGGGMTPSGNIIENNLGTASFGTSGEERVSLDADYRLNGSWHVYGGLNFTHFNYTGGPLNSPLAQLLGAAEPPSSTNLFGMQLGVAYGF